MTHQISQFYEFSPSFLIHSYSVYSKLWINCENIISALEFSKSAICSVYKNELVICVVAQLHQKFVTDGVLKNQGKPGLPHHSFINTN